MPNRLFVWCFSALICFPLPFFAQSVFDSLRVAHRAEVFFAFGKHNLDSTATATLDSFAGAWKANSNSYLVRITAHTDSVGSIVNNTALSQRRANAVRDALAQRGVPESQTRISYFGENLPVTENDTEEGRQRNRRATLELQTAIPMSPYFGKVTDKNTGEGIAATVHFSTRTRRDSVLTDSAGHFAVRLPKDSVVKTEVYAAGYFFESALKKILGTPEMLRRMQAEPLVIALPRAASGEKVAIKNFYFVGNEAILLKTSEPELPKVLKFMQVNPEIRIEIAGHINNPFKTPEQLEKWEWSLAVNRAKLVYDYLRRSGVAAERMTYKGYGNTEMLFPLPSATAEQQEQNRRVEIRVK
ncbi:MAG: OmpA family protein [Saprospiraceae bacterium]|jgi:outer membrane protein OmpA-like peptidoglycan-associated protein|nr:OmpA family protein [Saprospiraceae bacterium]